jgi:hypothetical protein
VSRDSHVMRDRGVRVRAALTSLAFLVASLIGMLHEATTVHVRCAAHGELIDGGAVTGPASPPARDALSQSQSQSSVLGDDHCLLASAMRESRAVSTSPALVAASITVDDVAMALSAGVQTAAASLYRIAPKTSPPA